ncbi:hypothetical protein [Escherichia phage rV5_ev147]|nr:hypothetical protein [Escherichia phage rV5_ev147]VVA46286.1 hypothetical protein [Escherichia phage rV5_ev156]
MLPHHLADVNGFYSFYIAGTPGDCLPPSPGACRETSITKNRTIASPVL